MRSYFYTQEEEEWLKNNARKFINSVGLTEEFNRKFGKTKKSLAIRSKVHHLIPNFEWWIS